MKKFCVFCGKPPTNKSKEHIIPLWLIELTGDPSRKARFGYDIENNSLREYSFNSFTFPSCGECNNNLSELEEKARQITNRILNYEIIYTDDLILFLDWFDKIRTGLWLAFYYLNKDICSIEPKFYINNRMRAHDRCLIIYKNNDYGRGLNFYGTETPIFQYMPSCFSLRINNFYFLNISKELVCSKKLGFPYIEKIISYDRNTHGYVLKEGSNEIDYPILEEELLKGSIEVYQPIFDLKMFSKYNKKLYDLYNKKHISDNAFDSEKGIGVIFYVVDGVIKTMANKKSEVKLDPNEASLEEILPLTYKMQNALYEENYNISDKSLLTQEMRKSLKGQKEMAIETNKAIIEKIEEGLFL